MTCIVGLVTSTGVMIGADSAGVGGWDIQDRKDVKVFRNEDLIIGCTTSFRMIQLLQYQLHPPKRHPDVDPMKYMVVDFVESVRTCFRNGGFITIKDSVEHGGTFLVGIAKRLFRFDSDFQIAERVNGFDACGCGENYALGALDNTHEMAPRDRVTRALETAARFSAGVREPFVIQEI